MKLFIFLLCFYFFKPVLAQTSPKEIQKNPLLAQNNVNSAFDPFIDYGEFQDNVAEEESMDFFQHGRSLAISLIGGYEAITLNMRQIYGDTPLVLGVNLSFFFDLHFAFQVHGFFPYGHYNSLWNSDSQFSHYGIDLKYYLTRQYFLKEIEFLNPYLIFGPFWINMKHQLPKSSSERPITSRPSETGSNTPSNISSLERDTASSESSFGGKVGLGIEVPLIKQSFIGLEVSFLYTVLAHENEDLSQLNLPPLPKHNPNQTLIERLQFPYRPEVKGFRFFGDIVNIIFLLGVNF